ncbi:hypothetical protein LDENG_00113150 [Lucifuga dentata]|nr:hypothetical protein LDENG_00113150 [Lucifuga dentata]
MLFILVFWYKRNIHRLQLIQNAAARVLTQSRRSDHISPVLANFYWLPVSFRIDFKILLLVFKALHNQAPAYICDLLTFDKPGRCLRSSDRNLLMVPKYGIPCWRTSDWLTQYLLSRLVRRHIFIVWPSCNYFIICLSYFILLVLWCGLNCFNCHFIVHVNSAILLSTL